MSKPSLERLLEEEFAGGRIVLGQVLVCRREDGAFELTHRGISPGKEFVADEGSEITKFDDDGKYRPLKTAPNLSHGWKIVVPNLFAAIEAIDAIYPGRLAAWFAWNNGRLTTTALRQTLNRQTGMYRAAAKISDDQLDHLVGDFCRSNGGCLRTILWRRDESGALPSKKLPPEKFQPEFDQTGAGERCIPLLCPEACNLLVAACRNVVKL